ncbi:ABC transporter substrate-binding protein [Rhabdaerophilum calidifontis]|uniref:ABC transporter substrate-binding protein n=1 Tax=Rhabdaerophilum calidifontis TaxID=2604328 RepID=UPI00123A148A|nr:ABC transporter substrate-binding protein [Rhabdaerophilum calidifontis]
MTMKFRIDRRRALGLAGGALLAPVFGARVRAQTHDTVSFQTNWRAQAEQGGFYFAVANGIYRKYGIEADIRAGGPGLSPSQLLIAGAVDMIMSSGFEAIRHVEQNLPILCIAAIFQKDPQVIICHSGQGNDSLAALKGKPMLISAAGRASFYPFLKARFGYSDTQIRPYAFNTAPFLADKAMCQQGDLTAEPYVIEKEGGVKPVVHLLADSGYAPYSATIAIGRKMVEEKPDLVQRFVTATLEGWAAYMKNGEGSAAANALIKKNNPDMTDDRIAFAVRSMNEKGIVLSGDALKLGIGAMTGARWLTFYRDMTAAGIFPAGLDISRAYSLQFVNKGTGI